MSDNLQVEDLVINDSFCNYCFQNNETDILYWQEYLLLNPGETGKIEEAMQIVLALRAMLQQDLVTQRVEPVEPIEKVPISKLPAVRRIIRIGATVAAVLLAVFIITEFAGISKPASSLVENTSKKEANFEQVVTTANGVKKSLMLPDSTTIFLNSGSELKVVKGFGESNRIVYLSGEALFDVTHNESLPFIVRIQDYDIKVLGTLFNVRAYDGDRTSETALIEGKIQIMKKDGSDLTLVPLQKMIFKNKRVESPISDTAQSLSSQKILPVAISKIDGAVVEAAWAQNRLELVNENFASIESILERWYNVRIVFRDEEVKHYTFTATFEKESIQDVLTALQLAYHFNFTIEKDLITIWK